MTMGPDPMSRIFWMSVRFGMASGVGVKHGGGSGSSANSEKLMDPPRAHQVRRLSAVREAGMICRTVPAFRPGALPMYRRLIPFAVLLALVLGCGKKDKIKDD